VTRPATTPARQRLTLGQALLTAGLVAVLSVPPLLVLVEYTSLARAADQVGIAQGVADLAVAQRDAVLTGTASAVLAVVLGLALGHSLRRTVRRDFERAYTLLEHGAAERVAAQTAAERTDRRSQALVQHAVDTILVVDAVGRVTYANPAAAVLLGRDPADLLGTTLDDVVSNATREAATSAFERSLAAPGETLAFDLDIGGLGRTGWPAVAVEPGAGRVVAVQFTNLLADPAVAGIVVNANDVTERTLHAHELERLAYHDRLTGLGNRLRLEQHVSWLSGGGTCATVLVLDVDHLGAVNDRYGDDTGDALLRALADRLVEGLQPDTVYHLGGDEFAVLSPGIADAETREHLVARVRELLAIPVELDGATLEVSAGIGVAAADLTTVRGPALLRLADAAMHDAKALGSGRVVVMDEARATQAEALVVLTEGLAHALERDELEVWYQPIVRPDDRSWVTVEALLRWRRPDGLVSPALFIPAAEMSGLIVPIGRWVLATALQDLARLRAETGLPLLVNVNVSASQLHDPGFVVDVLRLVADADLPPSALVLELTESAVLEDPERAIRVLAESRASGMHVALDDFGTGYSSLSYLQRLPVSSIKVDRSFLEDVETSERTRRLLTAVVAIAHDLDLQVTIEGVETEETMQLVTAAGCDTVQGFLVARPVPVDDLLALARASSVEAA
jgi:diguanylate cyclase (GGDEF)-like protein/PAS domain S-box-containing protein